MLAFVTQRISHLILVVFGAVTISFSMIHLIPGDPAQVIAGQFATRETVERVRNRLGLDRPLYVQFGDYIGKLVRLDLGKSYLTNNTVAKEISISYPITFKLAIYSLLMATLVGVPLGVVAAANRSSGVDLGAMVIAMGGLSMPNFWLGLNLIYLFAVKLGWLPALGSASAKHYILPSVTLAAFSMALIARQTRSSMLEVMTLDYIRTARAKGLPTWRVMYKHALKNALIPVITVISLNFGYVLGGTVVTESVFAMRGMGMLIVSSILDRDYPVVQAGVLVLAVNFAVVNLAADLVYAWIDPRIRYD